MGRTRLIGHLNFSLCLLLFALTQANGASLLVRGGTLINGTGGVPIANARILITDGRIARVWSGDTGAHLYSQPPVVANLDPALIVQGGEVWVRVTGANFSPNSVVLFDGKPVETKFVGDNELHGRLTARQTSHPGNYLIGVKTPKPGGGVAEGLGFIVDYW